MTNKSMIIMTITTTMAPYIESFKTDNDHEVHFLVGVKLAQKFIIGLAEIVVAPLKVRIEGDFMVVSINLHAY